MIVTLENPILREHAKAVTNYGSDELKQIVDRMFKIMREKDGVGIAAPQIGESLRIFVYGFEYSPRYPDAPILRSYGALMKPLITKKDVYLSHLSVVS